ncbi:MAG: hypothetical protein DRR16_06045 [Candidatus Parabeggiatoa sp. nov. 3]|jgi:hypothetical protein|nr:MAG: hypothetical protein DRQ99_06360 [Gammaproteobacteria bacterium]RKZ87944.1 MAG: hypothetical protein DRR16_06045 [Gammaproteobacteria bacterium]
MNQPVQIGFSQPIKRAWLDFTVQHLLAGQTPSEIRAALNAFLSDQVAVNSTTRTGARQKAIGILSKIWVNVPQPLESFRNEGLTILKRTPKSMHLAVHWGMAMAVYPFFAVVAEQVGRLLRLQQYVSTAQLRKRLGEKMGEREPIIEAARKLMRCWVEWGVLADTGKRGTYTAAGQSLITDIQLTTWLLESALIARESQSAVLHNLINYTPALFPFSLSSSYFIPNERLELFSQGVNETSVTFNVNC